MQKSDFVPPVLLPYLRSVRQQYGYTGNYPDWAAANAAAAPYRTDLKIYGDLIERLKAGEWEPKLTTTAVLSGLLLARGKSRVLDFGGNLGMAYFKTARVIPDMIESWRVVELPPVVDHGRKFFADNRLSFFERVEQAALEGVPNVVLCACTLQYLSDPYSTLESLASLSSPVIVIDRAPLAAAERFMVQRVHPSLGGGSFPLRVLSESKLAAALRGYKCVIEQQLHQHDHGFPTDIRCLTQVWTMI